MDTTRDLARDLARVGEVAEMTMEGLRVCREIAQLGSFTAAARALGYSQPAISRQVAAMEDAVGVRLFTRETRGIQVTPAGALVVEHAARILGGVSALRLELDGLGDHLAGRVGIGAFPAAMAVLVPRAVAHLSTDHPGLSVALTEAATPTLLRDLRGARLAVAVVGVGSGLPDYDLDGLVRHPVYAGDLCVAVPAGHRLARSARVGVTDLIDEPWIAGTGSAGDPQFAAWPTLSDPVVRFRVRSWPARLGLVAAGMGMCVLPEMAALSVPAGVYTVGVEDPNWSGRRTLALTALEPTDTALAVVAALRGAAGEVCAHSPAAVAHRPG